ncbi:universal stress protein [Spirulina subsalsa]|uniref:universal stress protein n=1 Tax=Spirulina subsalsa TaxID=54311 RepID=UPI00036FF756|nr:universal stress protein [Spirulina subsalsa]
MFETSLICTDFSDGLHRLMDFIPHLAAGGLKNIVFVHSVPLWEEGNVPRVNEKGIEKGKKRLAQALENIPAGVNVQVEVPSGKPADTIPKLVQQYQAEVVFTGTPTRSLMQEQIFGSTTAGLTRNMNVPLMILRPQLISTYTREELELRCQHLWRYLLIPYNDGPSARYLIEQIKELAQKQRENFPRQCMLVWVLGDVGRKELLQDYKFQAAQERLAEVKAELEGVGLEVNTALRSGNPLQEILEAALTFDITAIATSTRNRNALLEFTAPSFSNEVLRRCWFPVLFFSPKR